MTHPESHAAAACQERISTPIASKLEKRLWQYAIVASAAGVAMLANPQSVERKVVYTPANAPVNPSFALDLNHDGVIDFNLIKWHAASIAGSTLFSYLNVCHHSYSRFGVFQCISSSGAPNASNLVRLNASGGAADLPFGAKIGPGERFGGQGERVLMASRHFHSQTSNTAKYWRGPWANGGAGIKNRYLGLRFKINHEFHFGWARVTITTTAHDGFTATLTGYAYETVPNQAINAGQTSDSPAENASNAAAPEVAAKASGAAASLGVLALGADGLPLWRKEDTIRQ